MKHFFLPVMFITALSFVFLSCGSTPKTETPQEDFSDIVTDVAEDIQSTITEELPQADNSSALEKAEAARNAAIAAGADKTAKKQFEAADSIYEKLKEQSDSGLDMSIPLADVEKRYSALEQYAKALEAKKKIEDNNLVSYDQDSYDAGNKALSEFEDLNNSTNLLGTLMYDKANLAYGKYVNVLNKAYKKLAKEARTQAFVAKKNADGVKAAVASKNEYTKAAEEFKKGDASYAMQNAESAYNHYLSSKSQFETVYTEVSARREAAQKAIDEAKARVLESLNKTLVADKENPLEGDNVEGIEEEDAVLLEADNYVAPETQEADIPEDIVETVTIEFDGKDTSLEDVINDAINKINSAAEAK